MKLWFAEKQKKDYVFIFRHKLTFFTFMHLSGPPMLEKFITPYLNLVNNVEKFFAFKTSR